MTTRGHTHPIVQSSWLNGLECQAIIGVNPEERTTPQPVVLHVVMEHSPGAEKPIRLRELESVVAKVRCRSQFAASLHHLIISKRVSKSSFLTLEALACSVAHAILVHTGEEHARATIRAAKPHALRPVAAAAEVEISRTLRDYEDGIPKPLPSPSLKTSQSTLTDLLASVMEDKKPVQYRHRAALALGANLGDRFANIELALRLLETPPKDGDIPRAAVVDTSFMYETAPMYVTDQPKFINCACMVGIVSHDSMTLDAHSRLDRDRLGAARLTRVRERDRSDCWACRFLQEWPSRHRRRYPHVRHKGLRLQAGGRADVLRQSGRPPRRTPSTHSGKRVRPPAFERVCRPQSACIIC